MRLQLVAQTPYCSRQSTRSNGSGLRVKNLSYLVEREITIYSKIIIALSEGGRLAIASRKISR